MSPSTAAASLSASEIARIETIERDAWLDMYAAAPPDLAGQLGLQHRLVGGGALLISRRLDNIQFNRLTGLGVLSPARQDVLEDAISAFDQAGVRNWIVHVAQGSEPLDELCMRRGLVPHRRTWAKFVRGPEIIRAPTDLAIRAIEPETAQAFGTVAAQAFGMPPAAAQWLSAVVGRPRWTCFMAFDGETPVATGATFIDGNASWLGIGGTLASHRGRGAQPALLAARIEAAAREGCVALTTETGVPHAGEAGPSYRNIERAGFRIAYLRPNLWRG